MFKNIGGKIKVLAKVIAWVGIVLSVLMGILTMAGVSLGGNEYVASGIVSGILIIIVGVLSSWIGSWFMYGFGELVENSAKIAAKAECPAIAPEKPAE